MQTVAFLRGMNVGGHRLTNDTLRAAVEALGFTAVKTYRASGNVIFDGDTGEETATKLANGLQHQLGYAVPTILRSAEQVQRLASARPFTTAELEASRGKTQVTLLAVAPSKETVQEVLAMATATDRLAILQQAVFWLPAGGTLETGLDLKRMDALLGLGTTRTQGTLQGIAKKLG